MKVSCLLLAAGDSTRMSGANKLMLSVDSEPIVRRTLREITKVPLEEVVVVTGYERERIESAIDGLSARAIFNENHLTGMHSSIRAGLHSLKQHCDAFFVCLADQPYFDHRHLLALITAYENSHSNGIVVPTFQGKRGHPVLISSRFIPEILEEPDSDYGCSYLFKRHPGSITSVSVATEAILIDLDEPSDYQAYLESSLAVRDPMEDFFAKTLELRKSRQPFAIASVIEVMGSASAKTGSKAIFDHNGNNLLGWVGGGCAERFIGQEAKMAIEERQARIVHADLDDEIFGLGVACGGTMNVFIDPILPPEVMPLPITGRFNNELRTLCGFYGWQIQPDPEIEPPQSLDELLIALGAAATRTRGRTGQSLRLTKDIPAHFRPTKPSSSRDVTIVGRTRITEALARHFILTSFSVRVIGPALKKEDYPEAVECLCLERGYGDIEFRKGEIVVIASHTSQDPEMVRKAIEAGASHVAMVGSLKRAIEVLSHLDLVDKEVSAPLFVPAGLDIDAKNPEEIALSVVAEVLSLGRTSK